MSAVADLLPPPSAPALPPRAPARADLLPQPPTAAATAARAEIRAFIADTIASVYRAPIPDGSIWQWADAHVVLDSKASPRPGPYRSRETPWVRRFTDIAVTPGTTEALVIKSSRSGFTEAALNVIRFMPEHMPGNALFAIDSKNEAKNISRDRLLLTASAGAEMSDDPDDDGTFTKFLRNMTVYLTGSYSPGTFRNKWLRLAVLDEVEVNPEISGEGTTIDLARSRFTGVRGARLLAMTKPKKHGSLYHQQWASGTCEIFLVPCPHCGTHQELTFDGRSATEDLHLDKITGLLAHKPAPLGRVAFEHCRNLLNEYDKSLFPARVHYQCVACPTPIREDEMLAPATLETPRAAFFSPEVHALWREGRSLAVKQAMALSGHWLQTNPTPYPGRVSQHFSDLYSSYEEVTWAQLALRWVDCLSKTSTDRDHFRNNHLGLPIRDVRTTVTEQLVRDCISPYERFTTPWPPHLCMLTWDTQDDVIEWGILAFRLTKRDLPEVAVVNWGACFDPHELLTIVDTPIEVPGGEPMRCAFGLGDAGGHRTAEIYDVCLRSRERLYPCFGRGGAQMMNPIRETKFRHGQQEVTGYLFSDDQFKRRLYIDLIGKIRDTLRDHGRNLAVAHPRLHLPVNITDAFVTGLTKERMIEHETKRGLVVEWDANIRGNEEGDIVKIGLVGFEFARPALERQRATARDLGRAAAAAGTALEKVACPNPVFRPDLEESYHQHMASKPSAVSDQPSAPNP